MFQGIERIAVASTSPKKTGAVESATRLPVRGVKIESGVNDSPIGLAETARGADNRIEALIPQLGIWELAAAIENGMEDIKPSSTHFFTVDLAPIVFAKDRQNKSWSISPGVVVPPQAVAELNRLGPQNTNIGKVTANLFPGIDHQNPHSFWTCGLFSRQDLLAVGIKANQAISGEAPQNASQPTNFNTLAKDALATLDRAQQPGIASGALRSGIISLNGININVAVVVVDNGSGILGWSVIPAIKDIPQTMLIQSPQLKSITETTQNPDQDKLSSGYLISLGAKLAFANINLQQQLGDKY